MPFNIEASDIIVLVILAIVLFGPSKLPEIGRGLGKAIVEFRSGMRGMADGFRDEMNPDRPRQSAGPAASPRPIQAPQPGFTGGNFCTQCGAPNPPGGKFCSQCGEQILKVS